jgi:AsmA family
MNHLHPLLRIFLLMSCALVLLFLVMTLGLTLWLNPNDFKPQIRQAIEQVTGCHVSMRGEISWLFFPLGLRLDQVSINRLDKPLARAKQVDLYIHLIPLFHHRLEISKLKLIEPKIILENNKPQSDKRSVTTDQLHGLVADKDTPPVGFDFFIPFPFLSMLSDVVIQSGNISYVDSGHTYDLNSFQLTWKKNKDRARIKLNTDFHVRDSRIITSIGLNSDVLFRQDAIDLPNVTAKSVIRDEQTHAQATVDSQASIKLVNQSPRIMIQSVHHANEVNLKLLEIPFLNSIRIDGLANLTAKLNTQADQADLLDCMTGKIDLRIVKGSLLGFDARYWMMTAKDWISHQQHTRHNAKQTNFDSLTGTFFIKKRFITNPALLIKMPDFEIMGRGWFSRAQRTTHYILRVNNSQDWAFVLPIYIDASPKSLRIYPDLTQLVRQQAVEDVLQSAARLIKSSDRFLS